VGYRLQGRWKPRRDSYEARRSTRCSATRVTAATFSEWCDRFLAGGGAALESREHAEQEDGSAALYRLGLAG
jgi:hypothetical protein